MTKEEAQRLVNSKTFDSMVRTEYVLEIIDMIF